nr:methyltransferase domain-containing protein [Hasllibacter sp. MH4015]
MTRSNAASFWNKAAQKYAKSKIGDVPAYEATLDRVRAHLRPEDRVLEMGCGTASTAILLAPHAGHITASDISTEMVEIGRAKLWEASIHNVMPVAGRIGEDGLDGMFDTILAFNLLHLIEDLDGELSKVAAQLPKGGLFISKTPCLGNGRTWLKPVIAVMQAFGKAPFVRFITTAEVERRILAAGFEIVETGDYPAKPPSHFVVARRI